MRFILIALLGCLVYPSILQAQNASSVITGKAVPELKGLDSLISSFIETNGIPGASLAVAKDGKLIYARGFGFADLERRLPVQPQSLFRIASISKTITAAALFKLVDDGKVNLSDKVYDLLKLKRYHALPFDERWKQITVQNLLDHKGGFDRGLSGDPMFKSLEITKALNVPAPARPEHVIRFMLSKKLDFSPNQRSEYSNFGYSLLGRVIEQASGKTYEKYVQDTLLHPIGIRGMKIGNTLTTAPGEVRYYDAKRSMGTPVFPGLGKQVPAPYGTWCLESMDAHGGWIASAPDLARFGSAFDQPDRFPAYSSPSLKGKFGPEYTFFGGLPGTSTVFRRTGKGITWVLLFNTNKEVDGKSPADIATPKVQDFLAKHTSWPTHDLFTAMQYDQKPARK